MKKIKIFLDGQNADYEIITFSGGERHVQFTPFPESFDKVKVVANIQDATDIIDLLLLVNAVKMEYSQNYMPIDLIIPYMPYARQDRACAVGQAFSMKIMAQMLYTMDIKTLVTWDIHSQAALDTLIAEHQKRNDIQMAYENVINVEQHTILAKSPKLVKMLRSEDAVLICPDNGAIDRVGLVVDNIVPDVELVQAYKNRNPVTGAITNITVDSGDLAGKTCIIVDDIGDGLGTFLGIASELKKKNAKKIVLYVTHGIFSKGIDVCVGLIDEVYCSNSIPLKEQSPLVPVHVIEYK